MVNPEDLLCAMIVMFVIGMFVGSLIAYLDYKNLRRKQK